MRKIKKKAIFRRTIALLIALFMFSTPTLSFLEEGTLVAYASESEEIIETLVTGDDDLLGDDIKLDDTIVDETGDIISDDNIVDEIIVDDEEMSEECLDEECLDEECPGIHADEDVDLLDFEIAPLSAANIVEIPIASFTPSNALNGVAPNGSFDEGTIKYGTPNYQNVYIRADIPTAPTGFPDLDKFYFSYKGPNATIQLLAVTDSQANGGYMGGDDFVSARNIGQVSISGATETAVDQTIDINKEKLWSLGNDVTRLVLYTPQNSNFGPFTYSEISVEFAVACCGDDCDPCGCSPCKFTDFGGCCYVAPPPVEDADCIEITAADLKAVGATLNVNQVALTAAYTGNFVYFDVDIPDGNSAYDYENLSLTYKGVSGDIGHKNLAVSAGKAVTPPGSFSSYSAIAGFIQVNGTASVELTYNFNDKLLQDLSKALTSSDKARFAINMPAALTHPDTGTPTVYELSNIKLNAKSCNNDCATCDSEPTPVDPNARPAHSTLVYQLFETPDDQLDSKTVFGDAGTVNLQDAGAQYRYVEGPPQKLEVKKGGTDSWRGLDVKGQLLTAREKYWIKVTGGGVAPGTPMTVSVNNSVAKSVNAESDGTFNIVVNEATYASANVRIGTSNTDADFEFEIYSIEIYRINEIHISFAPGEAWEDKYFGGRVANPNDEKLFRDDGNGAVITVSIDETHGNGDSYSLKVERTNPSDSSAEAMGAWNHSWIRMGAIIGEAKLGDEALGLPNKHHYTITAMVYVPSAAAVEKTINKPVIMFNDDWARRSVASTPIVLDEWTEIKFSSTDPSVTADRISIGFPTSGTIGVNNYPDYWYIDDVKFLYEPVDFHVPQWDLSLPSLKDIYKDYFLVGNLYANSNMGFLDDEEPPYNNIKGMIKHHYNTMTAENVNKPEAVVRGNNTYNYATIKRLADWSDGNGMKYIAHTLIWNKQSHVWLHGTLTDPLTRADAKQRMQQYINAVAGSTEGVKGQAYAWDVVNEAFVPGVGSYDSNRGWREYLRSDTLPTGANQAGERSAWYASYANGADAGAGEHASDFIYDAFVFARIADPAATLYYNDFNDDDFGKCQAISAMVKEFNERWVNDNINPEKGNPDGRLLIEGIGLQAHYNSRDNTPVTVETAIIHYITENPRIKLSVTELDFTINQARATAANIPTEEEFNYQGMMYAGFFNVFKKYAAGPANPNEDLRYIERVTFWGTHDEVSWRRYHGMAGATGGYPTLFHIRDGDYAPKPAFWAVVDPDDYLANYDWPEVFIPKTANAVYTDAAPAINGTSTLWSAAPVININNVASGDTTTTGQARVLWDADYLYARVEVSDDNIDVSSGNAWEQDSVELFVSEINHRDAYNATQGRQYRVSAENNQSTKEATYGSWESYAEETSYGYVIEYMIPWWGSTTIEEGLVIGLDFQINDPPPASDRPQITWCDPGAGGYGSSEKWGEVTLVLPTPAESKPGTSSPGTSTPPPSTGGTTTTAPPPPANNYGSTPGAPGLWNAVDKEITKELGTGNLSSGASSNASGNGFDHVISTGSDIVVPAQIFNTLQGTAATLMMDTGSGVTFSISGGNIPEGFDMEKVDLSLRDSGLNAPPAKVAQVKAGTITSIDIPMVSNDSFGMVIGQHFNVGTENAGNFANLYRFNEVTGEFDYLGSYEVNDKGQAMFGIAGGGDYVLTVSVNKPNLPITSLIFEDAFYTVVRGDNLARIAHRYGMTLPQIRALNPEIRNPGQIRIGQKIRVR